MLDLSVLFRQLTQGQPPADMTLLHAPQPGQGAAEASAAPGPSAAPVPPEASASVDARMIAERVYELMRKDLRIQNERRAR